MKFQVPRGTRDILPGEVERWQELEKGTREVMALYGYREVRTPMFEATDLFVRSVGETTDIVRKELYTFTDRKGRSLTLRPEGTAPLVRAYLESSSIRSFDALARLYYIGPMFRYERPQAGRYRQFGQIGAELLGSAQPLADVEMIDLLVQTLKVAGLAQVTVLLNSLGDATCRPVYRDRLREYFAAHADALCGDCRERIKTNPLRILDCKVPSCQPVIAAAPSVLDSLCESCRAHFGDVRRGLGVLPGLEHEVAPRLVRGLDYYTRTVFEVHAAGLGAQNAVGGGGRYDRLVEDFGGPETPAIGFSIGMERLLAVSRKEFKPYGPSEPVACVVALKPEAGAEAVALAHFLRGFLGGRPRGGLHVEVDVAGRSASAQVKWAAKIGARYAVFVPRDAAGYAVRNLIEGRDEPRQPDSEALLHWLLEHRAEGAATR